MKKMEAVEIDFLPAGAINVTGSLSLFDQLSESTDWVEFGLSN